MASVVCGILFLVPAIRALVDDPTAGADPTETGVLGTDLPANDERQDYLRATLAPLEVVAETSAGRQRLIVPAASAHARQDSSMLGVLERSEALIVRPPRAPPAKAGEAVPDHPTGTVLLTFPAAA